jgi:hypothetical protein
VSTLDTTARAQTLSAVAYAVFMGGEPVRGFDAANHSAAIAPSADLLDPLAYLVLGHVAGQAGRLDDALTHFEEGLALARVRNDWYAICQALGSAAGWAAHNGADERGASYLAELEAMAASSPGQWARGWARMLIATAVILSDPRRAITLLDDPTIERLGNRASLWSDVARLRAWVLLDEHGAALEHAHRVARRVIDDGLKEVAPIALHWGAASLAGIGDVETAVELGAAMGSSGLAWGWVSGIDAVAVDRVERASRSLPGDVIAAARATGSKLTLGAALALFVQRSERHIAG